ncbi:MULTISPECIES: polyprenyl diphosphate synthase [unclassified Anaerobiospirillum]|uniref:polyprenyl diphosphate synthase n=1 Tax=unclassified Anaerobiospirillum TaxID=2647410 RepID=UPI001FF49815|nr:MULTISPECIES: polyprenyl diphosphate synthase [unclassified Anaerobiospirillum]MCK0534671.1 polyprenyl diphosphate synthase [Anaerobiospirillum sp. NML120511]MCK0539927.1 polyprenyl diphosphate synthase [Anaerobiospirillum sp. NML02-A-032]
MQKLLQTGEAAVPRHLAIIMDGNGRWAKKRGMMRLMGHRQGARAVTRTVEFAASLGVSVLTLFAFSSENWKRPPEEVSGLMELFAAVLKSERDRLHKNNIKVRFVGDLSRFSEKLRKAVAELQQLTASNTAMQLNIAINYGGRWDITQAARSLALDLRAGLIAPEDITEQSIQERLTVLDDVDLLIRTGGESRISNFLLYQCAYSEFYVCEALWPDFDEEQIRSAVTYFNSRERRFGMTSEQVATRI